MRSKRRNDGIPNFGTCGRGWRAAPLALLLWLLSMSTVPAAPTLATGPSEDFERIGGATTAVVAWRDQAHALVGSQLRSYSLAEGGRLRDLDQAIDLPDLAEDLARMGDRLYLPLRAPGGSGQAELRVHALEMGSAPRPVGQPLRLPAAEVGAIAADYPTAFLITEAGLLLVDLKDPDRPALLKTLPLGQPRGLEGPTAWRGAVVARDGLAWIARPWGLYRLDAREGRAWVRPMDAGDHRALALGPEHLAALRSDGSVTLWEHRRIGAPVAVLPAVIENPSALAWIGDRLLVVGEDGRALRGFDVADPTRPRPLGPTRRIARARSEAASLALAGPGLLLASERGGLIPLDATGAPSSLPDRRMLPPVTQVSVQAGVLLAAAGDAGLYRLRAGSQGRPEVEAGIELERVDGQLRTIDPLGPEAGMAAPPAIEGEALRFQAAVSDGQQVFAFTERAGLVVLDLGPGRLGPPIAQLAELPPLLAGAEPLLRDGRLYLPGGDRSLRIVDVRDPSQPRLVGLLPGLSAMSLAWWDGRLLASAYGTQSQGRLAVVDLSDPGQPVVTARVELAHLHERVNVVDGFVYLTGSSGRVEVVELEDPDGPRLRTELGIAGLPAGRLDIDGQTILAGQLAHLDRFHRFENGSLVHLSRMALPSAGLDWLGRTDLHVAPGQTLMLRGRSGLFVSRLPDAADAVDASPDPQPLFLPGLFKQGLEKPTTRVCLRPSLVALNVDASLLAGSSAERERLQRWARTLRARLRAEGRHLVLGHYGDQAETVEDLDAPVEMMPRAARAAPRVDLAMVLAQRQAEALGVAADRASLIQLGSGAGDAHGRWLAERRERDLDAAGWRIARVEQPSAKSASRPAVDSRLRLAGVHAEAGVVVAEPVHRNADLLGQLEDAFAAVEGCRPR